MKRLAVVLAMALVAGGCAAPLRGMVPVPASRSVTAAPPAGKAAVVFLRPELIVGNTASVFELRGDDDVFVGHALAGKKLLYLAEPGPTRFMVLGGGGADFMSAELVAGKTYYARVVPGRSVYFTLRPVTRAEDRDLAGWLRDSEWVETGPQAQAWAKTHERSIRVRKAQYLPTWTARPDRPALVAADGR